MPSTPPTRTCNTRIIHNGLLLRVAPPAGLPAGRAPSPGLPPGPLDRAVAVALGCESPGRGNTVAQKPYLAPLMTSLAAGAATVTRAPTFTLKVPTPFDPPVVMTSKISGTLLSVT
jgi:hypothetical protein